MNDFSFCADTKQLAECNNCLRNPKNTANKPYMVSWIFPKIETGAECLSFIERDEK